MNIILLKIARILRLITEKKYNEKRQIEIVKKSEFFDEKWYLEKNPDVKVSRISAAKHYVKYGWKERRNPSAKFDTNDYIRKHSELLEKNWCPLFHLYLQNRKEKKNINNDSNKIEASIIDTKYLIDRMDILNSQLWDENYFLSRYYDGYKVWLAKNKNSSPLDYYLQEGWKQKQWPSNKFVYYHPTYYNMNPLIYFLNFARFDGYQFEYNVWHLAQSKIDEYWRKKHKNKKVVYTCIINNYDNLINHYFINDEWDYICFTDNNELIQQKKHGIWKIEPLRFNNLDATRNNRWHKLHPHILFPDYDESIYIDANINILTSYLFDLIEEKGKDLLFPIHFNRNCIYQEIDALMNSPRFSEDDKKAFLKQKEFLKQKNFPDQYGLGENNILYRKHHSQEIIDIMNDWWNMLINFSKRDQTSFAFVMWKHHREMMDHMFVNTRVNYKNFWVVKHLSGRKNWSIECFN